MADKDVLGETAPSGGHSTNEGGKYDHWMDKEIREMARSERTEASADERAFREGRAGMEGGKPPGHDVFERERGDSGAGRNVDTKFEAEEFDVNQWDRGDERRPSGHMEGGSAPRRRR